MKHIGYIQALGRPLPQYRDDGHWPPPAPDVPATDADVAAFLAAYPDATCTPTILRVLAQIHRDFAMRPR